MFTLVVGTGKSALMNNLLRSLDNDQVTSITLNMNSFSDASSAQMSLEQPLEKKSGTFQSATPSLGPEEYRTYVIDAMLTLRASA